MHQTRLKRIALRTWELYLLSLVSFSPSPNLPFAAFVLLLFEVGGPTAIAWFVVAVIVDALKRVVVWSWSHVGVKVFELLPALADFDAASTIVFVAWVVGVLAALPHAAPGFVFRSI